MPQRGHSYGDAPIEEEYAHKMQALAKNIDAVLNGSLHGGERTTGFILLVFPYGEKEGRCNYISNGADRSDVATLLEEQAKRFRAG